MVILPRLAVSCFWKERLQSYPRWRVGFGCPILLCRVGRAKCGTSWIFLIVTRRTEYAYLIKFYEQNLSHCKKFRISKARRQPHLSSLLDFCSGGVLLEILRGGVPPGSPNPDPTSDKKMSFSTPVFWPGLWNPYPFSDRQVVKKTQHYHRVQRRCVCR